MKSWVPRLLLSALLATAGVLAVGIHVGDAAEAFRSSPSEDHFSAVQSGIAARRFGRLIRCQQSSVSLGQTRVIEEPPGAGTTSRHEGRRDGDPDGYTLSK